MKTVLEQAAQAEGLTEEMLKSGQDTLEALGVRSGSIFAPSYQVKGAELNDEEEDEGKGDDEAAEAAAAEAAAVKKYEQELAKAVAKEVAAEKAKQKELDSPEALAGESTADRRKRMMRENPDQRSKRVKRMAARSLAGALVKRAGLKGEGKSRDATQSIVADLEGATGGTAANGATAR